jgi:hypothetical protein
MHELAAQGRCVPQVGLKQHVSFVACGQVFVPTVTFDVYVFCYPGAQILGLLNLAKIRHAVGLGKYSYSYERRGKFRHDLLDSWP